MTALRLPSQIRAFVAVLMLLCGLFFTRATANSNALKESAWLAGLGLVLLLLAALPDRAGLGEARERLRLFARQHRPLLMALGVWAGWLVFQTIRSSDPFAGIVIVSRTGASLLAFFLLIALFPQRKAAWLRTALLAAAALCAVYLYHQLLGYDFLTWEDERRPIGTWGNPNFSANFLVGCLPLAFAWETKRFVKSRVPWRLPFLSLFLIGAILVTESRAGLVGLIAASMVFLLLLMMNPEGEGTTGLWRRPQLLLRTGLLAVLTLEIFAGTAWLFFREKLDHLFSSSTIQLRLLLWKGSLSLWGENPLFGHGTGTFRQQAQRIKAMVEPISANRDPQHAHNWLIEMLVEQGLLGTILWFVVLAMLATPLLRAARKAEWPRKLWIMASLAGAAGLLAGTLAGVWMNWWGGSWLLWLLLASGYAAMLPDVDTTALRWKATAWGRSSAAAAGAAILLIAFSTGWSALLESGAQRAVTASQPQTALPLIKRADALPIHGPMVPYWRAVIEMEVGELSAAEKTLARAQRLRPGYAQMESLAALIALRQKAPAESLKHREAAWDREPSAQRALELGQFLLALKRVKEAETVFEAQLARAPEPKLLHSYLELQFRTGRKREARDFLRELRGRPAGLHSKPSTRTELARWEGELSGLMGEWGLALSPYQEALRLSPRDYKLWNDYGLALKQVRAEERAYRAMLRASELAPPGDPLPRLNAMELAVKRGDQARVAELRKALEGRPLPPGAAERLQSLLQSPTISP